MTFKSLIRSSVGLAILSTAAQVAPISAASAQEAIDMETIFVQARRRVESLQDVPLSITAINQGLLRDANAFGLEDVAAITPGLSFTNTRALGAPTIRGLQQTDGGAIITNVGVFLDGIYINNRSGFEFAGLDLQQVEVAKGPQSALFGRDSFAGAINYVTRGAVLGEFDAEVQGDIGTDDRYGIKASINIPVADKLAVRVFGGYSSFDGTIENTREGATENLGGWDKRATIGGQILFEPTDNFRVKVFGVRNEVEEDQPPLIRLDPSNNTVGANYENANGTFFTLFEGDIPRFDSVSLDQRGTGNTGGITLLYAKAEYDFDFATLSALVSHTKSGYDGFFDNVGDLSAVNRPLAGPVSSYFFTDTAGDTSEQQSYELQLASNQDGPFEWLVGASYYDTSASLQTASQGALLGDINSLVQISDFRDTLDQDIFALFGSASYEINDKIKIGGEIRYTSDKQDLTVFNNFIVFGLVLADTQEEASFDYLSGRATIEYRPNDDHLIYFYAGRGVKTGGVNGGREGLEFETFDPETNWTYELGTKSTFFEGRVTLNTALFYIDWQDLQATIPGDLSAASAVFNGPGASSKGIEIETVIQVTDTLTLNISGTVLDPTYDDPFQDASFEDACREQANAIRFGSTFLGSNCTGAVGGNQIGKTSTTQLYTSLTHVAPELVAGFDMVNRIDFTHEGRRPTTSLGFATIPATNLVNYRLSFRRDKTEISFWIDNALGADWIASTLPITSTEFNTANQCRSCSAREENVYPGNGRQFGLTVVQRF